LWGFSIAGDCAHSDDQDVRRGVWIVCVFAELAVPRLTAQSPPVQPAPNQRSLEEVIRELEAMKQPHGSIRAAVRPLPAAEGSKSLSHRCAQNSGLGDWSAKSSWNGGAQGLRMRACLGCSQRPTHTGAGQPRMPGPMISGLPRSWQDHTRRWTKDRDLLGARSGPQMRLSMEDVRGFQAGGP
jgi:hypothetical protein